MRLLQVVTAVAVLVSLLGTIFLGDDPSPGMVRQKQTLVQKRTEKVSQHVCGAAVGCAKANGSVYKSPLNCRRFAGAKGCVWLEGGLECCGRPGSGKIGFDEEAEADRDHEEEEDPQEEEEEETSQDGGPTPLGAVDLAGPESLGASCERCAELEAMARADADRDGIPDCAESPGCTFFNENLYSLGARPGVRDIFVEVGWMAAPEGDEGVAPRLQALKKVEAAFLEADEFRDDLNLSVHFVMGQQIPYKKTLAPEGSDRWATIERIRSESQTRSRRAMFYYMIFGSSVNPAGNDGPSGGSHIKGTLIYISLGGWLLHSETEGDLNLLVNTQAATVMHELGHALGLRHGGGDNIINKPNYISIMNYLYQTSGLPKLGHPQEGDRFYLAHPACNTHLCSGSCTWDQKVAALHDGPRSKSFRIGYSHGQSMHIDESAVSEQGGLADKPGEGTTPVDFNCDGNISSAPIRKLVHDCIDDPLSRFDPGKPDRNEACAGKNGTRRQRAVLNDHDDWGQLSLFFAELYDPSALDLRLGAYLERLRREGSSLGITF